MSGLRRFTLRSDRARDAHERARGLAASGISEVLRPDDASWLATHLDGCRPCREAVVDYALQGERVRSLPSMEPPRDLAAALAARLDVEEARVADERARVARRRSATSQAHPLPRRAFGSSQPVLAGFPASLGRPTPFAAAAAASASVAFVAIIALVAAGLPALFAPPAPTPFAIDPSAVAWVTREADGRYVVQASTVDRVCPGGSASCSGFGSSTRTLMTLDVQPASIILSRGGRDAIVVDTGAAGRGTAGGSVYAVKLQTPIPDTLGRTGAATASATADGARPSSTASVTTSPAATRPASTPRATAMQTSAPLVAAGAPVASATAPALASVAPVDGSIPAAIASLSGATPIPVAASRLAILEDVVLVGGRAAYSEDGKWFGFSARPADGSTGPDVYVWRVGDPLAHPITSDHASVFSAWVGDKVLASTPDGRAAAASVADAEPTEPPSKKPKPTKQATPVGSPDPDAAGADASTAADASPAPRASAAEASPGTVAATTPASFLLDPKTGARTAIGLPGLWLPSVDPTGRLVVGWLGTVTRDAASGGWRPVSGALGTGPWSAVVGDDEEAVPDVTAAPGRARASAIPTPEPTAEASADASAAADAASPAADGTPKATPRASGPSALGAPGVTPAPTASPLPLGLRRLLVQPSGRPLPAEWQVRWDENGTHLAVWFAEPKTPGVGRLSLVSFDDAGVESGQTLLAGAPALAGFAIGPSRLAWATPPDAGGTGSRVRVLVWSGAAVGETGSAPITGLESLVDAD